MLSDKELVKYSEEDLFYEIWMSFGIGEVLARSPVTSEIFRYALVESFVIHLHNLILFLDPSREPKPGDVTAAHFFDRAGKGKKKLPPLSAALRKARTQAHKDVGHFTAGRISRALPENAWEVRKLLDDLKKRLQVFAQLASETRLHPNVKKLVDSISRSPDEKTD